MTKVMWEDLQQGAKVLKACEMAKLYSMLLKMASQQLLGVFILTTFLLFTGEPKRILRYLTIFKICLFFLQLCTVKNIDSNTIFIRRMLMNDFMLRVYYCYSDVKNDFVLYRF